MSVSAFHASAVAPRPSPLGSALPSTSTGTGPHASAAPETPVREREPEVDERQDLSRPWNVIVWDDPVNLMSYVVFVLRRVFGYPEAKARKLMLEVHHLGKATVASEPRERAEMYVQQLHGYGLQATMERA